MITPDGSDNCDVPMGITEIPDFTLVENRNPNLHWLWSTTTFEHDLSFDGIEAVLTSIPRPEVPGNPLGLRAFKSTMGKRLSIPEATRLIKAAMRNCIVTTART
jgi:hypothetical protein